MAFGDFTVDRNNQKYVLGSGGTIVEYAEDEPAFEFNTDGSYKGLLVEPAATNICLQSEDFSTTWTNGNNRLTITTNATTAPDGTSTADEAEVNTTDVLRLSQAFTSLTAGNKYVFSFFAKKSDNGNTVTAFISNSGETVFTEQTINLDTLVVTGSTGSYPFTVTTRDYGSGWYRLECATEVPAGQTTLKVNCLPGSESTATATGANAFFWGAQVETGPIATSYIPTTTGNVQRVKDDITLGSASSLIGQTEGTLYVEVDWRATSGVTQYLLSVNNSTFNNQVSINNSSGGSITIFVRSNGSPIAQTGVSSSAYSGIQKFAFAYKTDDFEFYRNGSSIITLTSGSLSALATLTDIDLGHTLFNDVQANMWIRAVALYPTRLSDAECQALTTL